MRTGSKHVTGLCLTFVLMAGLAVVMAFAHQGLALAASLKQAKVVPHVVEAKRPVGSAGFNDNCDATGATGCGVTFSGTASGTLSAAVGAGSITIPTLDGAAQTATFSFPTTIADTRGVGGWTLSAASSGLTVNTLAGPATVPFVLGTVSVDCTSGTPVSCTGPANVVTATGSLTSTAIAYASVPTASGDYGATTVVVSGTVPLDAATVGGSYSGTITVTAAPSV